MTPTQINTAARTLVEASVRVEIAEAEYAAAGAAHATAEQVMIEKGNLHVAAVEAYNAALAVFNPTP